MLLYITTWVFARHNKGVGSALGERCKQHTILGIPSPQRYLHEESAEPGGITTDNK
jgi:hypothetical protein